MVTILKKSLMKRIIFIFILCGLTLSTYSQNIFNKKGCVSGNCENGQGTYTYPDGTIEKGLWEKGKYLGEEKKD